MDKYPILNSMRSVKFIIECRCCGTDENYFIFYKIRIVCTIVCIYKRNFLKFGSFREVVYENIPCFA